MKKVFMKLEGERRMQTDAAVILQVRPREKIELVIGLQVPICNFLSKLKIPCMVAIIW